MAPKLKLTHLFLILFLSLINREVKAQQMVGQFHSFAHDVKSGDVTILDDKTIEIKNFNYDGTGPAGRFVVGKGDDYTQEKVTLKDYIIIPNEEKSCAKMKGYKSQTINLTLPEELSFKKLRYLSAFCIKFNHNWGYIAIPQNLDVVKGAKNDLKVCSPSNMTSSNIPFVSTLLTFVIIFWGALNLF